MKNLLKMSDLSPAELTHILDVADQLKAQQKLGGTAPLLAGKTVALMFSKASTRTRDRKSTRLNSSHTTVSRMPSSA